MLVGRIGRAHGLQGGIVVEPETDIPSQRFAPGASLWLADGTKMTVRSFEATERSPILRFAEIPDRSAAERLRGQGLYIPEEERRQLAADEHWPDELVGMDVVDVSTGALGRVVDVEIGSAQDRLIVATPSGEFAIPLVDPVVQSIDDAGRIVYVDLPPGLID